MDKKDDNKKPSKDKKKDKKDKKDKKKKVIKKKSDDKISQSQIVNIKIGDISKPKTRRKRAAPKAAPPPPQIQRQLQYLPSLAGQAPMIPQPLAPAPTPPPAPPRPPPPPAPAAEPRRTGDFFSDTSGVDSRYGTTYDLGSTPEVEYLGGISRSSNRPTLSQSLRSRSGSEMSSLTDVDFGEAASSGSFQQFGGNINLNDLDSGKFGDDVTPPTRILRRRVDEMSVVDDLTDFDMKEQRRKLRLNNVTQSTQAESESEEGIIGRVQATGDDDSIESYLMFDPRFQVTRTTQSTQPEEALGAGADFEDIAAPSVVNVADNLGFVSSQQPQEIQELQPTQTPSEAPPIEAQVVEQLPLAAAVPVEPRISETLQERAGKGDVEPEDEAAGGGGGGRPPIDFYEAIKDPVQQDLIFKTYILERQAYRDKLPNGVKSADDGIRKYNLRNTDGNYLSDVAFRRKKKEWLEIEERKAKLDKVSIEELKKKEMEKSKKKGSGAAAESPKKEAKKQGSGAAAASPKKQGKK